jgi:hypothetical protein
MKKQQITHIKDTAPTITDNIANGYNIGQWWQNTTTGKKYFHKTNGVWIDIESSGGGATWGGITGTLSSQTDLQTALDSKVDENAPITPATKTKITYDEKGLVTDGDGLAVGDIPTLPQSKITDLITDLTKFRKLIISNPQSIVTGTTAETIISSLLIPANSFDSLCDIWSTFTFAKNTGTAIPLKLYYNTTNSLTGATQISLYNTGSNRNGMFNRKLLLNGTGLDLVNILTTTSSLNNENFDNLFTAPSIVTINPAVDIYFIYTVQNDSAGTTFTHKRSTVEKLKL